VIKYGDEFFYSDRGFDDVCAAIRDGEPVDVYELTPVYGTGEAVRRDRRITFYTDPDYVAVEL